MASIRVEKKAFTDPRFKVLAKRMGTSRFDARGRMEEVWSYCTEHQTYFVSSELINEIAEWENFSELILDDSVGLAEKTTKGIRIKGTRGNIEWLAKLRKNASKGGKATSANRRSKTVASGTQNKVPDERPITTAPAPVPASVPVLVKKTGTKNNTHNAAEASSPEISDNPSSLVWRSYCGAYKIRYHTEPIRNAKVNGQLKQFCSRVPIESAPEIAAFYLRHNNSFYVVKMHSIGMLLADAEKLHTEWKTNRTMTSHQAHDTEKTSAFKDQLQRIASGEI